MTRYSIEHNCNGSWEHYDDLSDGLSMEVAQIVADAIANCKSPMRLVVTTPEGWSVVPPRRSTPVAKRVRQLMVANGSTWDGWTYDSETSSLVSGSSYEVSLSEVNTCAQMLDWIFQVFNKSDGFAVISGLLSAFEDIFHPQETMCSHGRDKTLRVMSKEEQDDLDRYAELKRILLMNNAELQAHDKLKRGRVQ